MLTTECKTAQHTHVDKMCQSHFMQLIAVKLECLQLHLLTNSVSAYLVQDDANAEAEPVSSSWKKKRRRELLPELDAAEDKPEVHHLLTKQHNASCYFAPVVAVNNLSPISNQKLAMLHEHDRLCPRYRAYSLHLSSHNTRDIWCCCFWHSCA